MVVMVFTSREGWKQEKAKCESGVEIFHAEERRRRGRKGVLEF
jgi:hypothetical protein